MRYVALLLILTFGRNQSLQGQESSKPNSVTSNSTTQVEEMERRMLETEQKVSPAIIFVQEAHRQGHFGDTGAIVTKDGFFLYFHEGTSNSALAVVLPDGRRVKATALGSSREWGISLGKLEGDGPWPFVPLQSTSIQPGQPIATFAFALNEPVAGKRPLIDLNFVDRSSEGYWFAHGNGTRYQWQMRGGLAFDLDGRLLGIENSTYPLHGTIYTHADRAIALWSHLVQGKNVDQTRLDRSDNAIRKPSSEISADAQEKAIASSVRIMLKPGDSGAFVSGTNISPEGIVVTCAHHFLMPGSKVVVSFADGRDFSGEVTGISFPSDIGIIKITDEGSFPFAEVGESSSMVLGDACLIVGYGPVDGAARMPSLRNTQVVSPKEGRWSYMISTDSQATTVPGDSGGGLFDSQGRLIAFGPSGMGIPGWPREHVRVEILAAQEEALQAKFGQSVASKTTELDRLSIKAAEHAADFSVVVLQETTPVAHGNVVSEDGKILTKASSLPAAPQCRLSDGRILPAKILQIVQEHDLAILKVEATGLPTIRWSDEKAPDVGRQVTLAGLSPTRGTVAHSEVPFASEQGRLNVTLEQTERGIEVTDLGMEDLLPEDPAFSFGPQPLKNGDILVSVEGRAMNNLQEFRDWFNPKKTPIALAGDRVQLSVKREGQLQEVSMILRPLHDFPLDGQTARRSGFSRAFGVLSNSELKLFGGAALDRKGRVVGIVIAARQSGWNLVLPIDIAQSVVSK